MGISSASAQESYRLRDGGKLRDLVVAADEIHLVKPGAPAGDIKAQAEGAIPGAKVSDAQKGRALVTVPARATTREGRSDAATVSRTVPGAEVEAVLYPPAAPRDARTRRIATAEVLVKVPAGETAAGIAAATGATTTRRTSVADRVLMHFPSGFHALDAGRDLRARGVEADVQIRRQHALRSVPDDTFFPNQWHLRNSGQGGGVVGVDANVLDAWDITTGTGVTIAVVDDSLQTTHPDLDPNTPLLSTNYHHDFNGGDNDPAPESGDRHGTSVGGVAAGKGNNAFGISGSAPDAQLVGIRLISGPTTDFEDASALYWNPAGLTVGVSNNSWGPTVYYAGPDILTKQALQDAAELGRGGLGQITLFAGGNSQSAGNGSRDSNADSFANSRFVIGVGASNNFGEQCTYSQRGANLLVCAPSSDPFNAQPRLGIWTTDNVGGSGYNPGAGEPSDRDYTNSFGGTSSATPLVAGSVALMLAANPNLGWRDVHEIVAATAVQLQPADLDWVVNGGGFKFNHKFGGGMINTTAAVVAGMDWDNLGTEITGAQTLAGLPQAIPDSAATPLVRTFDFSAGPNLRVERAEIVVKITHSHRSDLEITLTSPEGTRTILSELRPRPITGDFYDDDINVEDNGQGWTFTTTHSWGENSAGIWTLRVTDRRSGTSGTLDSAALRLFGTAAPMERVAFELPVYSTSEASGTKTVRVKRVGAATGAFSVDVLTSTNGTATEGLAEDFNAVDLTLDFADGDLFKDVVVPIHQDLDAEPVETIYLLLKNAVDVALGGVPLTVIKIVDDETRPVTIVATDAEAAETATGLPVNTGTFTITRAAADATPLTVNLSIGGTAMSGAKANGGDYLPALPTSVTIPAFEVATTLTITPENDAVIEGSETIDVTVLTGLDYDVGTPSVATVTINDNDLPQVNITAAVSSVLESSPTPVNFTVSRGVADPGSALIVKLQTGGTAKAGVNYIDLPLQVEIPIGAASVLVPLQPKNDDIYIPVKTVVLHVAASPNYIEGFNASATINIIEDDPLPDAKVPTVKIASPKAKARINAPGTVAASGTALDNESVARVIFTVNGGPLRLATGTTAWTADLTPDVKPGPNTLIVQSEDADQNRSKPAAVIFNYVQPRVLSVAVTAGGSVSKGFSPQATLEAGQTYSIVAKPETGFVFAGWSGGLTEPGRVLTFVMPNADTALQASFVADPFVGTIKGVYTGPVRTPAFAFASCGLIQMTINAKGSCSGKLYLGGVKITLKGEFNGEGRYKARIARKIGGPLDIDLTVALAGVNRTMTGTVANLDFSAAVNAELAGFSKTSPYALLPSHPKTEIYTFYLPPPAGLSAGDPRGTGHGRFTIDANGTVKWTARLRDGTTTSGAVPLNKNATWAFFGSLYKNRGLILGNLAVDKMAAVPAVMGTVDWLKVADAKEVYFPNGFTRLSESATGCLYTPPAKNAATSAFGPSSGPSGTVVIEQGNLAPPAPFTRTVTVGADNKAAVDDGSVPRLTVLLKIDAAKGLFSGSFVDPKFTTKKTLIKFDGVIVQDVAGGFGCFRGATFNGAGLQTGSVKIDLD